MNNNSIKLIDIDKLYIGLNEKMIAINPNDFDEIINNAIVKKDEPSKLNIKSDIEALKDEIKEVKKELKSDILDEHGFPYTLKLREDIDKLNNEFNIIKANQKNDYNSLVKKIDNYLLPIDTSCNDIDLLKKDIKTLFDDIEDIKNDMDYKINENDVDDAINDSSYFHDLESKVEDLEAYSHDRVELSYVESIDNRLKRIEIGIISRVFDKIKNIINNINNAFGTIKKVRITIKK